MSVAGAGVVAEAPVERDRSATFQVALRWTLVLAGVALLVLLVTGLYLTWNYQPSLDLSWNGAGAEPDSLPGTMSDIHRISSLVFVALALVAAVMAVVLAVQRHTVVAAATGCSLFFVAFSASVTGSLLPWDQVAFNSVTVGTDFKGFDEILRSDARYVLVDGHELAADTFTRWFWIHTAVLPIVLIALAALLLRFSARSSTPEGLQRAKNEARGGV